MKKTLIFLCFLLATFLLFSYTSKYSDGSYKINNGYAWEEYDPSLFPRLQNITDLINFADSAVGKKERGSLEYCNFLAEILRKRFYHGYSYYSFRNDWIACLSGKIIWNHLSAIVLPDDIMKHPMAACSQVCLVLKECFRRIGTSYRKVDLTTHFVIEGKINDQWYLFDPDLEPKYVNGRKSLEELIKTGELLTSYEGRVTKSEFATVFASPKYGEINENLAPNASLFHRITHLLSPVSLFLMLFFLFVYLMKFLKKQG